MAMLGRLPTRPRDDVHKERNVLGKCKTVIRRYREKSKGKMYEHDSVEAAMRPHDRQMGVRTPEAKCF